MADISLDALFPVEADSPSTMRPGHVVVVIGNALAPAYYWTGALAIGLTAILLIKESAPCRQGIK